MRHTARIATVALFLICAAGPAARARVGTNEVPPQAGKPTAASLAPLADQLGLRLASKADSSSSSGADVVTGGPFPSGAGTGGGDVREQEPNDVVAAATHARDVPFEAVGTITEGDVDYYSFDASAGERYTVLLLSHNIGATLDPFLVVAGSDGVDDEVRDDNVFGADLDATIQYTVPSTGTYYVGVSQSPFTAVGSDGYYAVWVFRTNGLDSASETEPNDNPGQADQIGLPGLYSGVLDGLDDVDYVQFNGTGGSTIVVDVNASVFRSQARPEVGLIDPDGRVIFANTFESQFERDPLFNIVLPDDGLYTLVIYHSDDTRGDDAFYFVTITPEDGSASPKITDTKTNASGALKKVIGSNFLEGAVVEINARPATVSFFSVPKPGVVKLKPAAPVMSGSVVTVLNPDGRRSNPSLRGA